MLGIRHKVRAINMMQPGHGLITNASNDTHKRKCQETYAQAINLVKFSVPKWISTKGRAKNVIDKFHDLEVNAN
jgi:hypothetical protein